MISYIGCNIEDNTLERRITEYVNKNLIEMTRVFIDYLNANDGFDLSEKLVEVLPRDYVINNLKECRNCVDELYELLCSNVIRDTIKPEYEYMLYHIIYYWMEVYDQEELPIQLDEKLEEDIRLYSEFIGEDNKNYMLDILNDLNRFLNSCFYDLDFLEDGLSSLVMLYLKSNDVFKRVVPDVNLDDYINLMPVDLRKLYLEKREKIKKSNIQNYSLLDKLKNDIIKSCVQLQGNMKFRNATEDEMNTFLASLLQASGFNIKDQTLWGSSNTGKSSGEVDIFISNEDKFPISIIEAMKLNSLHRNYIDTHLKKIWGYDVNGLKHNFIIVYSGAKDFENLWQKYIEYIKGIEYKYDFIGFKESKTSFTEIKYGRSSHERNGQDVYLHHVFVNMNS